MEIPRESLINIKSIVKGNYPKDRLHNWNLIFPKLNLLNLNLNEDEKSLIIAGDIESISSLVKKLFHSFHQNNQKSPSKILKNQGLRQYNELKIVYNKKSNGETSNGNKIFDNNAIKNTVDISNLDITKPTSSISNLLEFVIITLCRSLNLNPRQVQLNRLLVY